MLSRPSNINRPFANTGAKNTIPDTTTGSNLASFDDGFPPVTMLPIVSGGVPPEGKDFNGILFDITSHTLWVNAGGQYLFDSALSTAMGGYPAGMVLQNNAGTASYVSLIANNTHDFNIDPSQIGVTWGAYSGAAFSNAAVTTTGGTTTLSAIQGVADMITISGSLTANATIVFPATARDFVVVNNTTGAFAVTCQPTAGTGVQIKQGSADAIYCDGTNIGYQQNSAATRSAKDNSRSIANTSYADRASDRVGGFYTDTGAANAFVVATVPATTAYADGQTVRFKPGHNTTGSSTLNAGAGAKPLIRGDSSATRANDLLTTMIVTATYVAAIDSWIINGLLVPDVALSDLFYVTATQTLSKGNYNIDTRAGAFGCNLIATPVLGDAVRCGDYSGSWDVQPFTLVATGGLLIKTTTPNGTTWSDSTLIDNKRGHVFIVYFDGTDWRLS